jgi:DNA polymerase-3 subunit delta'
MLFDEPGDDLIDEPDLGEQPDGELPLPRFAAEIRGHDAIEKQFLNLADSGKFPHAMVFSGLQGIGKSTMAFRLAKFLLSEKQDSGPSLFGTPEPPAATTLSVSSHERSAQLIHSGGHPDLKIVERVFEADKNRFRDVDVEQIREVPGFLHMTPFMGGWRIVIIDDADTMTRSSQNALLKILEEPPRNSLLILIAHRPGALIPTIRSRSRMVEFSPPGRDDFDLLVKKSINQITAAELNALYNISGGSIGASLRLMQEGALKSFDRVSALLSGWPDINWKDVHLMGEVIGGKGQDETALQGFQEILLWACEQIARTRARGLPILPDPLNQGPFPRLLAHYGLEEWSKICDSLKAHFATVKYGSLDRRQAVFGAFSILAENRT